MRAMGFPKQFIQHYIDVPGREVPARHVRVFGRPVRGGRHGSVETRGWRLELEPIKGLVPDPNYGHLGISAPSAGVRRAVAPDPESHATDRFDGKRMLVDFFFLKTRADYGGMKKAEYRKHW